MNPLNKIFLLLAMIPQKLYQLWGVEPVQLRSILSYKLMMDDRRPNTFQATRATQNSGEEISFATVWTMLASFLMGLLFLFAFYLGTDYITQLTLYFSMFIVFLSMTLVGDFAGVLIDVRDNYIILPKPVSDQTVLLARLLHIFIHLCKLVLPMCLPAFLYLTLFAGIWKSLVYLICVLFSILFSIFLINAVYVLILRVTTAERFKNAISYIQIAFTILVFGAYQMMPRMAGGDDFQKLQISASDWLLAAPPYWFACLFQACTSLETSFMQYLAAALGVMAPLVSIYLVIRYLAPAFNQKLAMISGASDGAGAAKLEPLTLQQGKVNLIQHIARWLSNNRLEQVGFLFAWKMMLRSRDYKVKVYPNIGYLLVIVGINVYRMITVSGEGATYMLLFSIYFCSLIIIGAATTLAYSEKYKAAWVFLVAPVEKPGEIISGAMKAVFVMFYAAIALLAFTVGVALLGLEGFPSILFALLNNMLLCYGLILLNFRHLPFSAPLSEMHKGGQAMTAFMMLILAGLLGLLHFVLLERTVLLITAVAVVAIIVKLLINALRKKSWESILTED